MSVLDGYQDWLLNWKIHAEQQETEHTKNAEGLAHSGFTPLKRLAPEEESVSRTLTEVSTHLGAAVFTVRAAVGQLLAELNTLTEKGEVDRRHATLGAILEKPAGALYGYLEKHNPADRLSLEQEVRAASTKSIADQHLHFAVADYVQAYMSSVLGIRE